MARVTVNPWDPDSQPWKSWFLLGILPASCCLNLKTNYKLIKRKSPRLSHLPKHTIPRKVPERASMMQSRERANLPKTFSRFERQDGLSSRCTPAAFFPGQSQRCSWKVTTCMFHIVWSSLNPHQADRPYHWQKTPRKDWERLWPVWHSNTA